MKFYLGCAVWSYKGWVGNFYPPHSRPADFLSLYGQRLTTVECNTTFYAVPGQEIVARWAQQTPSGFKFCPKLPRQVTHEGLLTPAISSALHFYERMGLLGDKLGSVFAQLPPSYSPEYFDDLIPFLQTLASQSVPLALEVRHLDWFQAQYAEELNKLLSELGIGRVILDTRPIYNCPDDPQIESERRKPQLPLQSSLTAPFTLIRFISHPQQEFNQPYLEEWAQKIESWLPQGTTVYFFVHCPTEEHSPHTARHFQHLLEAKGVEVPPLPWDNLELPPLQLSLF